MRRTGLPTLVGHFHFPTRQHYFSILGKGCVATEPDIRPSHSDQKASIEEPEAALPGSASLTSHSQLPPLAPPTEGDGRRPLKVRSLCPARHAHPHWALTTPSPAQAEPLCLCPQGSGLPVRDLEQGQPLFSHCPSRFHSEKLGWGPAGVHRGSLSLSQTWGLFCLDSPRSCTWTQ